MAADKKSAFPVEAFDKLIAHFLGQQKYSRLELFQAAVAVLDYLGSLVLGNVEPAVAIKAKKVSRKTIASALSMVKANAEGAVTVKGFTDYKWLLPLLLQLLGKLLQPSK